MTTPTTRGTRARGRRLLGLIAALLLAPVGALFLVRGALLLAGSTLERRYPPPGQMVSVGGHRLHLYCQGTGTPTVVVEPGLGVDWVAWQPIVADVARSTEGCVYDRAGYGWSEPGPMPRTAEQSAMELHDLLSRSSHAGPVVLVAHSFGGYIARVYAGRFGDSLAGLVLVDPSEADPSEMAAARARATPRPRPWSVSGLIDLLPPLGWDRVKRLYRGDGVLPPAVRRLPVGFRHRVVIASSLDQLAAEQSELDSSPTSQVQASAAVLPRNVPLVVITPADSSAPGQRTSSDSQVRRDRHRKLADASALGEQVLAERSGHMVHIDRPDVVSTVIRDLVSRIRGAAR
jgi:pimeloyl-ACP methyl ester carboxylesterase